MNPLHRAWTASDVATLAALRSQGQKPRAMAEVLGRSISAVRTKLRGPGSLATMTEIRERRALKMLALRREGMSIRQLHHRFMVTENFVYIEIRRAERMERSVYDALRAQRDAR
ncbi:MAG: hypothetical protein ACREBN_02980 [Burkholderiaceae bacterium]